MTAILSYSELMSWNDEDAELLRLQALEKMCDDSTKAFLLMAGIRPGSRCLEVGAGAGSIARWMSEQVTAAGAVVAADIDDRFLKDLPPNCEYRQVNVVDGDIGDGYDIVHTRSVLAHIAERDNVLVRLAGALAPGGALVCEEPLYGFWSPGTEAVRGDEHEVVRGHIGEVLDFLDFFGMNLRTFGLRLPQLMTDAGLSVRAELRAPLLGGPENAGNEFALRIRYIFDMGVTQGALTKAGVERVYQMIDDPAQFNFGMAFMTVVGRALTPRS